MTEPLTPQQFLCKYTPSPGNQICACAGHNTCVYCENTRIVRNLLKALPVETPHDPTHIRQRQLDSLCLSRLQTIMLSAVRRAGSAGLASWRLVDMLYADDPNGGPLNPPAAIRSIRAKLNKQLRSYGWVVRGSCHGGQFEHFVHIEPI